MSDRDQRKGDAPRPDADERQPPAYEPPTIIWQEEWEPVALAVSCARLPAENPTCHAAPGTQ